MEVDDGHAEDVDLHLLQEFSRMGTTDKDVLIQQLQKLTENSLNYAESIFFLEMNNWNLEAAVWAYFEFSQQTSEAGPSMQVLADVTIGEGEAVTPNTAFVKTWRLRNNGVKSWPANCSLKFLAGDKLGETLEVAINRPIQPGEDIELSVQLISPSQAGSYQGQWRLYDSATGLPFGDTIWVIVTVAEGGILAVTQQLDACHA